MPLIIASSATLEATNPHPRPALSEAQIAANRANALKPTGPRTMVGKAISRGNADRYGMESSWPRRMRGRSRG